MKGDITSEYCNNYNNNFYYNSDVVVNHTYMFIMRGGMYTFFNYFVFICLCG